MMAFEDRIGYVVILFVLYMFFVVCWVAPSIG